MLQRKGSYNFQCVYQTETPSPPQDVPPDLFLQPGQRPLLLFSLWAADGHNLHIREHGRYGSEYVAEYRARGEPFVGEEDYPRAIDATQGLPLLRSPPTPEPNGSTCQRILPMNFEWMEDGGSE